MATIVEEGKTVIVRETKTGPGWQSFRTSDTKKMNCLTVFIDNYPIDIKEGDYVLIQHIRRTKLSRPITPSGFRYNQYDVNATVVRADEAGMPIEETDLSEVTLKL